MVLPSLGHPLEKTACDRHIMMNSIAYLSALDCVYLSRITDMLGHKQINPTPTAQDNNACIFLVKGSGMYNRAKHIDTRTYRIRELSESGAVKLYKSGRREPTSRHIYKVTPSSIV